MTTDVRVARREELRRELAGLLERDEAGLADSARLLDELALDSLAMMTLLTWAESLGASFSQEQAWPVTIGEVLTVVEEAPLRNLSITITQGSERLRIGPKGAANRPQVPADPLTPVLITPSLRMTPLEPDDLDFLYRLCVHPETSFRWRYRGAPPTFDRFVKDLWTHVLVQYVVRRTSDNQPIGLVVAYGPDEERTYAHVGAVFHPEHTKTGQAAQVSSVFVRHLFHTFRLRKLYLEIAGFNWPQMQSGQGRLFQIEGILRDHYYYAGQYWDKYIGAIYPDRLETQ